jgi:hypothetical protein
MCAALHSLKREPDKKVAPVQLEIEKKLKPRHARRGFFAGWLKSMAIHSKLGKLGIGTFSSEVKPGPSRKCDKTKIY